MKSKLEFMEELRPHYLSYETISREAHRIWELNDCPDGEQIIPSTGMKVKDAHWCQAQAVLGVLWEIDSSIFWNLYSNLPENTFTTEV